MRVTRRTLLKAGLVGGGAVAAGGLAAVLGRRLLRRPPPAGGPAAGVADGVGCPPLAERLDAYAENITSGGVPRDGIPPVEEPKYVPVQEAEAALTADGRRSQPAGGPRPVAGPEVALGELLDDDSIVFGLDYRGVTKAYPQIVLVWHEIVNEEIGGERISVTYCPLTGSVVGFRSPEGLGTTFGTSGRLLNSNLVMYDRETGSLWPQILGMAVTGSQKGHELAPFPLIWTTWKRWRAAYPDSVVLTTETGHLRPYGSDPYGSYRGTDTYYQRGGPLFPVMARDDRLSPKAVVVGVRVGDCALAFPKETLREAQLVNAVLGGEPLVALYDGTLDVVRVFSRRVSGRKLTLERRGSEVVDAETGSSWRPSGEAVAGTLKGAKLSPAHHFDVMWFAWHAFFPETRVWQPG